MEDYASYLAAEGRKTARRVMERIENARDIADALYVWQERALVNNGTMLLPGDCCMVCGEKMTSARGASVSMSPDQLAEMIDGGALHKLFNPDDLNAPDFDTKMDAVFTAMGAQAHFCDAKLYAVPDAEGQRLADAVAIWDGAVPGSEQPRFVSVERKGDEFRLRDGVDARLGQGVQATYENFNPGGLDVQAALAGINPERENKTAAHDRILEGYEAGGSNAVPSAQEAREGAPARPEDVPGYSGMSAMEKMALHAEYTDQQAELTAREAGEDDFGPKLPRQRRYDSM